MECTICGKESGNFVIMVNSDTRKTDYVCDECTSENEFKDLSLKETEDLLAQYESLAKKFEGIFPYTAEMEKNLPPEVAAFAMTPTKVYKMTLDSIQKLKMRRMKLICQTPQDDFLEKELKKAIEEEDFEKADILKKQLSQLKEKDKDKTEDKKQKQQANSNEDIIYTFFSKLTNKLEFKDNMISVPLIEEIEILSDQIKAFFFFFSPDVNTIKKVIELLDIYDILEIKSSQK